MQDIEVELKCKTVFESYAPGQPPWIESQCIEILFWNKGTSIVTLNNAIVLQPNDYFAIQGNRREKDTTLYNYGFSGAGVNLLQVVKRVYIDEGGI